MPVISLVIFFLITLLFIVLVQIQIFQVAFAKLGLTPENTLILLMGTLIGSGINLSIFTLKSEDTDHPDITPGQQPEWTLYHPIQPGKIVVAVNVGGCMIPLGLCLYFISQQLADPINFIIATAAISILSYKLSRPIPGLGIAMPMMIAPLASAMLAILLDYQHAAHIAYVSGVLGVLIGADICHLRDINNLGTPLASIGGAGTFDGIFMTGLIAALLA